MVEVSYERLATIFKALSDETRLHHRYVVLQ